MGDCGCGDFMNWKKLPGPDGSVYAIRRYYGCDGCGTPAAVLVARFRDPKEAAGWGVDEDPELSFVQMDGEDYEGQEAWIPVLDVELLRQSILFHLSKEIGEHQKKGKIRIDDLDDILESVISREIITEALFATEEDEG